MSSEKSRFENYYLGLDIGTDSVGWCVTDASYNILKFNGKAMWGIRLFDSADHAANRRMHRAFRRRLHRRHQRIILTQELLAEEIAKVDPIFYIRLNESFFNEEDKRPEVRERYSLFSDKNYTDREYHRDFHTIYHLRYALMQHEKKYDIRLYYLALSHFMKHRGHFLFVGDFARATSFDEVYNELESCLRDIYGLAFCVSDRNKLKLLLTDTRMSKTDKKRQIGELYDSETNKQSENMKKEVIAALCGAKASLSKLYQDEGLSDAEISGFSLSEGIDDDKEMKLMTTLGERFDLIAYIKAVYDWTVLTNILSGSDSISEAQIAAYEKHGRDLKALKHLVKDVIGDDALYNEIFNDNSIAGNYVSYTGHASKAGEFSATKKVEQKDFCDYLRKRLGKYECDDFAYSEIMDELKAYTFMPKQVMKSNSAIPYQVHLYELDIILKNLGIDYPSLASIGVDGLSACDKLRSIFKFRIPYYVGPLNTYHSDKGGNSWMVRKSNSTSAIRPWNFDKTVDKQASAEAFITRLTNKCTYLLGEDVIPKDSLLYSKFMVLNELNNLKINGERLSPELKQRIYDELFKTRRSRITLKALKEWLKKENYIEDDATLSGIDESFKAQLKSYQDFRKIIGTRIDSESPMVEEIIREIVIFGEDKALLTERITERYGDKLSGDEIRSIARLKYTGWGRLSEKLLNGITDVSHETGELLTIIGAMWEGQENLMELLSLEHDYMEQIRNHNRRVDGRKQTISYDLVNDSYASPAVKRGIWQTLLIIKELQRTTGHNPSRIFVEVAREPEKAPKRKPSRQAQLLDLYKNIKDEKRDWIKEIEGRDERAFSGKKLYLYYTQMGRDMYSGEPIDLGELLSGSSYDIDHIYPQSKTKDDSLHNNMVLVRSDYNRDKGDVYPVPSKYRQPDLWKMLRDKGLITKEKYDRLMRREALSAEELAGFIGRQLVETRQTTKVVTQILEQTMPDTKIVYSKAGAVSQFRKDYDFYKSRSVNDYHHAKDAYLNIVVGNAYYTKFTDNPIRYIRSTQKSGEKYSLNRMYDYDVKRGDVTAWVRGKDGTIATVRKYMKRNNIRFTRYASEKRGGFHDQMLLKKDSGQLVPIKGKDQRYTTKKYGGYNRPGIDYFMLVESDGKKGRIRTLEGVPVSLSGADEATILDFCRNSLGLKNPDIRFQEIRINSLIKVDGYPMHISGKTNARLLVKNAVQLCVSYEQEKMIHNIDKIVEKHKNNKNFEADQAYDGVDDEGLIGLYDTLFIKLQSIYEKRFSSQLPVMEQGRDKFIDLTLTEKCILINELLHLFQCNAVAANLSMIGGAAHAGVAVLGNEITKVDRAVIVAQSVTGLFEREIDLLTV